MGIIHETDRYVSTKSCHGSIILRQMLWEDEDAPQKHNSDNESVMVIC